MSVNKILSNRYQLLERVGVGGFSEVWKATDTETNATVALKLFLRQDERSIALFEEEYKRMQGFDHPNILKPLAFGVEDDLPYFVMQYCQKGTLLNQIGRLDEQKIAQLMAQIAAALAYIHARQIVHKDIKPDNILIDDNGNYVLTDFGISNELEQRLTKSINVAQLTRARGGAKKQANGGGIAPMSYRPPESFKFKNYRPEKETTPYDMWAFGATLYQVACKNLPFEEAGGFQQLIAYTSGNTNIEDLVMELPPQYSRNLDRILKACLEFDKQNRLTAFDLQTIADTYLEEAYWNFTPKKPSVTVPCAPKRATQKIERIPATDAEPANEVAKKVEKKPWQPFAYVTWTSVGYVFALLLAIGIYWAWKIGYPEAQLKKSKAYLSDADTYLNQKNYEKADSLLQLALIIEPNNQEILVKKQNALFRKRTRKYPIVDNLSDGLASFGEMVGGKMRYGYVDSSGRVNIIAQYDKVSPFVEGTAAVAKEGSAFYIDKKNALISSNKWAISDIFKGGKAIIRQNGREKVVSLDAK